MCKLILKAKGVHRVIIITDAMDEAALPSNERTGKGVAFNGGVYDDVRFIEGLGLAGSKLTMDQAVRNMMSHTGAGMVEAFIMASLNPAKVLKIDRHVGSLETGKRANLVIVNDSIEVRRVIFEGREVNFEEVEIK
jgi:N-acetylglucosamine-6-phosphate deacetylase